MNKIIKSLIITVTVLSAIVLLFLFFFSDSLLLKPNDQTGYSGAIGNTLSVEITADPEALTYDGKGNLDFMSGIKATDSKGKDVTELVTASVDSSNSLTEKNIIYSINHADYDFTSYKRTLKLTNYKGPTINVEGALPDVDSSDTSKYISSLVEKGILVADDGFGHNISEGIFSDDLKALTTAGQQKISFSVQNFLNDRKDIVIQVNVTGDVQKTPITLTTKSVSIPVNSVFDPLAYLESAYDENYGDLSSYLKVTNTVDTSTPGQYTVTYYIDGLRDISSASVTLNVVVTE